MIITASEIGSALEQEFPFNVEKFPLRGPDGMWTPHYGLFRSDTGECVGNSCSKNYTPHTTEHVKLLSEAAGAAFRGEVSLATDFDNGHHVIIGPSPRERELCYDQDGRDPCWPRLVVRAGYDGRSYTALLAMYRDACRNLDIPRMEGQSFTISIRHSLGLRDKMDNLIEDFRCLSDQWYDMQQAINFLRGRTVRLEEYLASVYPMPDNASERQQASYRTRAGKIISRIIREQMQIHGTSEVHEVSAWLAWQGVSGYLQHDARRRGNPTPVNRALHAMQSDTTHRALEIALSA